MPITNDDQQMEVDMITAMFGDTFEMINENSPNVKYAVSLAVSSEEAPELKVTITYPEKYPEDAVPVVALESIAAKRRIALGKLPSEVAQVAEDNRGMHSVAAILQHCQTYLIGYSEEQERLAQVKAGKDIADKSKEPVRADPTIRMGNSVTPELFKEWQTKHIAEKAARQAAEAKAAAAAAASSSKGKGDKEANKLTGRQLWDSSLKNADWELFGTGGTEDAGMDLDEAGFDYALGDEEEEENERNYDLEESGDN